MKSTTGSGGFSTGKESGNRNWVDDRSSLIGTGSVDVNVDGTLHLAGSQIANVKDGVDGGNLNISAGDLTWEDVKNTQENKSSGFGIDAGISLGGNTASTTHGSSGQYMAGSTSASAERSGQETEGLTLATLGQGNITIGSERDISALNRDIDNMDIITKDMITGALDFDVTVDHRLLSEEGRANIVADIRAYEEFVEKYGIVPNPLPGFGLVPSVLAQESHETDIHLEYVLNDDGTRKKIDGVSFWLSDQNPFFKATFHVVPFMKSLSEIHDVQEKQKEAELGTKTGTLELISTIPSSFAQSTAASFGVILDTPNWGKNWEIIKQSYQKRKFTK